jgi:ubiquinone/menaquinone biosynthesis C-methylase UbiE
MGFYGDRVLPRVIDKVCGAKSSDPLRQRVCATAHGDVIELGFGSGLNLPHYPDAVRRVEAVEPNDVAWRLSTKRRQASRLEVMRTARDAQRLPFGDNQFDVAVSTWTMCTIPDIDTALVELRRVLKPGGRLQFIEHGLAPDLNVQRWQHRFEPIQKRISGGCHLTRQITELIEAAGFTLVEVERFYEDGAPRFLTAETVGVAILN